MSEMSPQGLKPRSIPHPPNPLLPQGEKGERESHSPEWPHNTTRGDIWETRELDSPSPLVGEGGIPQPPAPSPTRGEREK